MNTSHTDEIQQVCERLLTNSPVSGHLVEVDDDRQVHIAETGTGPPLLLFHGTGNSALFLLPLLEHLEGIRALGVDRPVRGSLAPLLGGY